MNWQQLLHQKVDELGRRQVEHDTGMSKTTLSQVLNDKYAGNIDNVAQRVITAYANLTVECPVLGQIQQKRCANEQTKPFSYSNPQRVKLFKACQQCPNRNKP